MSKLWVEVAAGAILSEGCKKVLLAKRSAKQHQGNLWEFPGGKLEAGEPETAALIRELQEELGITPETIENLIVVEHDYPDKSVRLHVFTVHQFSGKPIGREGQPLQWVALSDLANYAFPEANVPIVDALLAAYTS